MLYSWLLVYIQGDRVEEGETITNKALIVGKFVADQMMGKEQTESCTVHTLDLHINELKVNNSKKIKNIIFPVVELSIC